MIKTLAAFLTIVALLHSNAATAEPDSDWAFSVEPYVMFSSIAGDASIGRLTGVDVDVDFGDILNNLDIGAMGHVEAFKSNKWGFILDYGFMKLSRGATTGRGAVLDADLRQGVMEAFAARRFEQGTNMLDVYAGIRWWSNEIGVSIDPALLPGSRGVEVDKDWVDPVIGARWHHPINAKWALGLRGDVGGFGVKSDFSSAVGLSVFYHFKPSLVLELAYRATWVDFDDGTRQTPGYFAYDTVTHGPLIGLAFKF